MVPGGIKIEQGIIRAESTVRGMISYNYVYQPDRIDFRAGWVLDLFKIGRWHAIKDSDRKI